MPKINVKIVKKQAPKKTPTKRKAARTLSQQSEELIVPTSSLLDVVLSYGLEVGATSIHLSWHKLNLNLLFRVQGSLREFLKLNGEQATALTAQITKRFSVTSKNAVWQERSIEYALEDKNYILNFTELRTSHGLKQVINIGQSLYSLRLSLDLEPRASQVFNEIISSKGLVPVIERSTSLRQNLLAGLAEMTKTDSRRIALIGKFVNYPGVGVDYLTVNSDIGFSTAVAIKSALRADYDVIAIDSIEKEEELDYAVAAASAGKLVLVGIPCDDVLTGFHYLWRLATDHELLVRTMTGAIIARDVYKLCTRCRQPFKLNEITDQALKTVLSEYKISKGNFFEAQGCPLCANTGRAGLVTVVSVAGVKAKVKQKLMGKMKAFRLEEFLDAKKTVSLFDAGLAKAVRGQISLKDIIDLPK